MILQRLRIKNFRMFNGESVIDFAPPGDRSITVLIGENQSGKTTLIHALRWCLYGECPTMENPEEVVNNTVFAKAAFNAPLEAEVQLTFEHGGATFRALRRHTCRKRDGGIREIVGTTFKLDESKAEGVPQEVVNPETRIKELLPPSLAPFFFFEGEAAKTWATAAGGEGLKQGVEDCLDLTVLRRAGQKLETLKAAFRRERKALTPPAENIDEQIDVLEAEKTTKSEKLASLRSELAAAELQISTIEAELGTFAETQPLIEEKAALKAEEKAAGTRVLAAESTLRTFIGTTGFLAFSEKPLRRVEELLKEAYARDEIPADVKPKFVDKLLNRGWCICETELPEGSKARNALVEWQKKSGLRDLSERLAIIDNKTADFAQRRIRAFGGAKADFLALRDEHASASADLDRVEGRLRDLDDKLRGKEFGPDHIKSLQAKRNELAAGAKEVEFEINDLLRDIGLEKYEDHEDSINAKIAQLEKDAAKQAKSNKKAELITKRMDLVDKIYTAATQLNSEWLKAVREYLDTEAKRSYREVGQLTRRVSVGEDFQLSVEKDLENTGHWTKDAPSESNQGVVALCFIAGFIALAKRLDEEKEKSRTYFQGGQFPMVMDAPFSDWGTHFCVTVSKHLADTVPQLVVMTKSRDWPAASPVLEPRVGKAYVIHFWGNSARDQEEDFIGKRVPYTTHDPDAFPEFSRVEGVK